MNLRIFIADDHELVRRGLRALFGERPGWQVCGEVGTGRAVLEHVPALRPDVLVLDLTLPDADPFDVIRQISAETPGAAVLALAARRSEISLDAALRSGARGFVLKSDPAQDLLAAVAELGCGRTFYSAEVADAVVSGYLKVGHGTPRPRTLDHPSRRRLTAHEQEVLVLLAQGKGPKEISSVLEIGLRAAETHRASIMHKLGMRSLSEIVRHAIRNGIIEP